MCRTVSEANPDHFRRGSVKEAALVKVGVLGDDGEAMLLRVIPHGGIASPVETEVPDVLRVREQVDDGVDQLRRQEAGDLPEPERKQLHVLAEEVAATAEEPIAARIRWIFE